MGEFFTGNSYNLIYRPVAFLLMFSIFVLLYGCGTILIRELRARWGLQWSVLFLLIAYGIFEEGLVTKAFFNTDWAGVGIGAGYGMYLGVQWIFTIGVTFGHATISTLIPIIISDYLWPEHKTKSLLRKKGLITTIFGLFAVGLFGFITIGASEEDVWTPFFPNAELVVATIFVITSLIYLAYRFRQSRFESNVKIYSPLIFGAFVFLMNFFFVFSYLFNKSGIDAKIALLSFALVLTIGFFFMKYQIYNLHTTKNHIVALVFGSMLFWILLAPFQELIFGKTGMSILLIITFILLLKWRKIALKNTN